MSRKRERRAGDAAGGREAAAALVAEAERIVREEQHRLAPRLLRMTAGTIDVIGARELVRTLGITGLVGAAAVLNRVSDAVAVLASGRPTGGQEVGADRRGVVQGWGGVVVARAPGGVVVGWLLHGVPGAEGRTSLTRRPFDRREAEALGDFSRPDFPVDPALDDHLARLGLPGAVRRLEPAADPTPPDPQRSETGPEQDRPASTPAPTLDAPWETAREASPTLLDLSPGGLGTEIVLVPPCAAPVGLATRPVADLAAALSEEQAVHLLSRVPAGTAAVALLDVLAGAGAPATAVVLCAAEAARHALFRGDGAAVMDLEERVVAGLDALTGGDPLGWLRARWPAGGPVGAFAATCWVALVAVGAWWKLAVSRGAEDPRPAVAAALGKAEALRDGLLDLCGAPPGPPGRRVVHVTSLTLESPVSLHGESRRRPLVDALHTLARTAAPPVTLRAFTGWHAAVLHTVTVIGRLELARLARVSPRPPSEGSGAPEGGGSGDALAAGATVQEGGQPGHGAARSDGDEGAEGSLDPLTTPVDGLLRQGREVLARHLVLRALEGPPDAAAHLDRAVDVAPWSTPIRRVANEGRYALGAWTEALLASLAVEEGEGGTLGGAAEALAVAEALGDRAAVRTWRRRLADRAAGTPFAGTAAVRVALLHPERLQDAAGIGALEAALDGAPVGAGTSAGGPAQTRAAQALLGDSPEETVAAWRRTLAAQREAVEWASLVRACRADEPPVAAPRPGRPACPTEPADDALDGALRALRWRLDRPGLAAHPAKARLEDHARAALRLVATGEPSSGAAWLRALGAPGGLVEALDGALQGTTDPLPALAGADAALAESLEAHWLGGVLRALDAVRTSGDGALQRERAALEQAAAIGDHDALERRLTDLLARAATAASVGDEAGAPDEADAPASFAPMRVPEAALERSRRALGTPEWAVREGLRQVVLFNRTLGRRDLKMLRGTRTDRGALWELRHRDGRNPVRVLYRLAPEGPVVVAVLAKEDDAHQARALAAVREWE